MSLCYRQAFSWSSIRVCWRFTLLIPPHFGTSVMPSYPDSSNSASYTPKHNPQFSQPPRTHSLILSLPHRLFQNLYCHSKPLIQTPVWHFQQCLLRNGLHSIQSQSPNPHHEILGSSLRETE